MNFLSFFLSFSSIHRAQQPRSGCPSNVLRRFVRRYSFNNWYRDLAYPSPKFSQRVKKCEIWRGFQHHSNLSRPCLKMQYAVIYPNAATNLLCRNDRAMSSSGFVKLGLRTPENRLSVVPHPLKLHRENVLNFAQISYRAWS